MIPEIPQFGSLEHGYSPQRRIPEVARSLRVVCGQRHRVPFDPEACARAFGLLVEYADLPTGISGRLVVQKKPPRIEIRRDDSPQRTRFTIAHEIAHLCFLENVPLFPKERGDLAMSNRGSLREERLCDQIAAELLMPRLRFERTGRAFAPSFDALRQLQLTFGVSLTAALRRVVDLRVWSVGYAQWRREEEGLALVKRRVTLRRGLKPGMVSSQIAGRLYEVLVQTERYITQVGATSALRRHLDIGGFRVRLETFEKFGASVVRAFVV